MGRLWTTIGEREGRKSASNEMIGYHILHGPPKKSPLNCQVVYPPTHGMYNRKIWCGHVRDKKAWILL
jgi:hypothetical protein